MGLMMWFMARGNRQKQTQPKTMSVAELRAEHERLGAEMERVVRGEEVRSWARP
jgi:hypothetical protein